MSEQIQRVIQGMTSPVPVQPSAVRVVTPPAPVVALTPREILGILRRHIWMIVLFTITGFIIGAGFYVFMLHFFPRYTAATGINVSPPITSDPREFTSVQPQKDLYFQFRATKAALMKQQDMLQNLIKQDSIRATKWFEQFVKRDADNQIVSIDVAKALRRLNKRLVVSAPRDQDFIRVEMTWADPKEAALIVNEMVRLFLSDQREKARAEISEKMASEERARQELRDALRAIQAQMDTLRQGSEFARLDPKNVSYRDYMDEKLASLYKEFSRLDAERERLRVLLAIAERRATQPDYDQVIQQTVEQDPLVRELQNSLNSIDALLAQQMARFGENHRRVHETRQAREQFKKDLDARKIEIAEIQRKSQWQLVQDEVTAIAQQLEAVTQQVQRARDEYRRVDHERTQYAKLEIEREEKQTLLEKANAHYESLKVLFDNPEISKLRSLGSALEPLEVSSPRWEIYLPAGFILGLLAGLILAFAVELLNDLVRTPSDVMRHLKVPLLGNICHADDDDDVEGIELVHVVRQAPYSIMSECYRQLRTNLKLSAGPAVHKTLLITSPKAGDGKTSVASNLASTFLAENRRILLIDANFRRPATAYLFPRTGANGTVIEHPDYGLSNYLMGQCTEVSQIIRPSGIAGLDIIDSGPLPSNPAELLDSPQMKELLEQCKTRYDFVLIDGPAMLVSDAKALAAAADGTLVVFNASVTHRGAAMRILRELQSIRANIVGTVLMGVRSRKGGYFQEVYRSYLEYQQVPVRSGL